MTFDRVYVSYKAPNHKVVGVISSFEVLMPILYKSKSVYFVPAGRVLPTKFFMGWSWMSGAVKTHLEKGNFVAVDSYEDITRRRIRRALSMVPKINTER